ncbi:MAG: hypothetical protein IJP41_02365 [Synergistaceae bacterium]|nr:hypothetical protein [Synergistaceae bacterium]
MTRKFFTALIFAIILACACYGLWPRVSLENSNKNVAILVDYREVLTLAKNSDLTVEEAIKNLIQDGVTGLMVSELTGDNIDHGVGQAEFKTVRDPERSTEGTIISIIPNSPYKNILNEWLRIRFAISDDKTTPIFLAMPSNMLKNTGIIPDIEGLETAKKLGLKIFYRPAPSPGHLSDRASIMLREVVKKYDNISVFTPSGEYVSGYPDVSKLSKTAHELNIPVAVVEFSRQVGEPQLNALASPLLMPLHSVTNEEMTARKISRSALRDRLIRAAVERSVRLLLLRTAPPNTSNFLFKDFSDEVKLLAEGLKSHGFNLSWPSPVFANSNLRTNIFTAWALSAILIYSLWCYLVRMGMNENLKINIAFIIINLIFAFLIYKVQSVSRLAGAFAAPLAATEASLMAMDKNKSKNILLSFIFVIVCGLSLASFFSVSDYMLRLKTFSGVKFTLIIPPILVLLHDLKNRIHPESLIEFLSRPPLWGELALVGVLLLAVGIIIFRSGNVAFIPGFEAKIRVALEKILIARPRTREVFIGYPSILILGFLVRNNLFAKYREIFRIGVALGFSSVINSFCHFHTPLSLILLREFNGLWTGLIVGFIFVGVIKFILIPSLKLIRPLIS